MLLCISPQASAVFTRLVAGSVAELVQQSLQKVAPPLNDAENQIIPVGIPPLPTGERCLPTFV